MKVCAAAGKVMSAKVSAAKPRHRIPAPAGRWRMLFRGKTTSSSDIRREVDIADEICYRRSPARGARRMSVLVVLARDRVAIVGCESLIRGKRQVSETQFKLGL